MKYFLAQGQKVDFGNTVNNVGNLHFRKATFQAFWQPVEEPVKNLSPDICSELGDIISGKTLQLEIGCNVDSKFWDANVVRITSSESCLERLFTTANSRGVVINAFVTIKNFGFNYNGDITSYRAKHTTTLGSCFTTQNGDKPFSMEWKQFYSSNYAVYSCFPGTDKNYDGELELSITLRTNECCCLSSFKLKDLTDVNHKILKGRIGADLAIVPSTGKTVPCHRTFLIAHSPAFESLVKGTFGDAKSNFLKMPELSEEGVQALIDYMYFGDTTKPEQSCVLALELYVASQKYEVKGLKETMRKLLANKADNWYKVDMLMKFYTIVKDTVGEEDLKKKAVRLIKANFETVQQSECYNNFYKDDLDGAKELVSLLLKI